MEHRAIPVALFNLQLRLHSLFCGAHRGESRAHGQTPSALAVLLRTPWRTSRLTIDQSVSMYWPCWSFHFCWCTHVHASMENLSRALRACALEQAVIALNLWVKASVVDGANARAHPLAQLHKQEPTRLRACMRAHARVHTRRRTQTHGDTRRHTHTHMSARAHTRTHTHAHTGACPSCGARVMLPKNQQSACMTCGTPLLCRYACMRWRTHPGPQSTSLSNPHLCPTEESLFLYHRKCAFVPTHPCPQCRRQGRAGIDLQYSPGHHDRGQVCGGCV